ncbi:tetratricopeptide repeat protein [bacterium]|nr:tetratricopeptide repeat protein [bacterium]
MNGKDFSKVLIVVVITFIIYNLIFPYNMKHYLAKFYVRTGMNCQKAELYDLSNLFLINAKKITPDRKTWYDYNIALNLRSKFWGAPMTSYKKKNLETALEYLNSENKNFPDHLHILEEFAHVYYQLEDYDKAVEYYEKCIEKDPNWVYGLSQLAHIYTLVKRDYEKSNEYVERALPLTNDKDNLYFRKAYNYSGLENYEDAAKMYERYLRNNPNSVAALVNITSCEIKNKNYDKAEMYVDRGLKLNSHSSYLLKSKVKLLIHKEKYDEADKIIEEMISRDKYDGYIGYYLKGISAKKQGNYEKADKYFKLSKENAQEYYDKYCEKSYDLSDTDGNCSNRFEFLEDFEEDIQKPVEL